MNHSQTLKDLFNNGAITAVLTQVFEDQAKDHDEAAIRLLLDGQNTLAYAEAHTAKVLRGLVFDISKDLT